MNFKLLTTEEVVRRNHYNGQSSARTLAERGNKWSNLCARMPLVDPINRVMDVTSYERYWGPRKVIATAEIAKYRASIFHR